MSNWIVVVVAVSVMKWKAIQSQLEWLELEEDQMSQ
jgi:hypothetical protein